jgi:hypothetical protein
MSLIRNEQRKLSATYLNGIAIATFALGCLAPSVAHLSSAVPAASVRIILPLGAVCAGISAVLHLLGRRLLKDLTE